MSFVFILISTAISIAVVAVSRYADRNNRSFEKIGKLSKNIEERLNKIAEEKIESLRDFDNCVEVSIQKGANLISQLHDSISDLETKFNELENEKSKISQFYQKIDMIDRDIAGIGDQVKEIHESSDFIKNAEEKLVKFRKDLALLEKDVGRMQDDLKKENALSLKNVAAQVLKETEAEIRNIKQELIGTKKEIEDKKNEMFDGFKNADYDFKNNIEKTQKYLADFTFSQENLVKENSLSLQNDVKEIESKVFDLKDNFINKINDELKKLFEENHGRLSDVKEDFARVEKDFNSRLLDKLNTLEKISNEIKTQGETVSASVKDDFEQEKNKQLNEVRTVYSNILKEIDRYNEKLKDEAKNNIVKTIRDNEEKFRILNEHFKHFDKESDVKLKNYENQINLSTEKFEALKNEISNELTSKISEFDNYISNSGEKVIVHINDSLNKISNDAFGKTNEITGRFENLYKDVENKLLDSEKNMHGNITTIENRISDEINTLYSNYSQRISGEMKDYFSDFSNFADLTKKEIEELKNDLIDEINISEREILESKDFAVKSFEKAAVNIDDKIIDLEEKIDKTISLQEDKVSQFESDIADRINSANDSFTRKIEEVVNYFEDKVSDLTEKSSGIEDNFNIKLTGVTKQYNDSLNNLYDESNNKLNAVESKYSQIYSSIESIEKHVNNEILGKIEDSSKRLTEEYKILEAESLNTINGFKNDLAKIKHATKIIEEKYSARLGEKLGETDKKLITKMQDVNEVIQEIKELGEKYNVRMNELDSKVKNYENDLNNKSSDFEKQVYEKINEIQEDVKTRGENILSDKLGQINEISSRFNVVLSDIDSIKSNIDNQIQEKLESGKSNIEKMFENGNESLNKHYIGLEKHFEEKIEKYQNDLSKIKDYIKELDCNFSGLFAEKLSDVDGRLGDKMSEINAKYEYHVSDLNKKLENLEKDFQNRLVDFEDEYKDHGKNLIEAKFEKLNEFTSRFNELENEVSSVKNNLNVEIAEKIEYGKKSINEIILAGKDEFTKQYKDLQGETVKGIEVYNSDLLKIKQNMKLIDEKFSGRFIKKLNEADTKMVEKLQEMNEKFKNYLTELNGKVGFIENDFSRKLSDVERTYVEKGEKMLFDRKGELDGLKSKYESLDGQLNDFKQKIEVDIAEKVDESKKVIEDTFKNGTEGLTAKYQELEEETLRNISNYKNELFKIKQNIQQIDDKFMSKFDKKLDEVDVRVNDKIQEINETYKDHIYELVTKTKIMENDFEKKIGTLEEQYNEKGNLMVSRNYEKVDEIRSIFANLNLELSELKNKIDSEVAAKIIEGKNDISILFENSSQEMLENYKVLENDYLTKINVYKSELDKVSENIQNIDKFYNTQLEERMKEVYKIVEMKSDEITSRLDSKWTEVEGKFVTDVTSVKDGISAFVEEFTVKINNIERMSGEKVEELYKSNVEKLNFFTDKFNILNQDITTLKSKVENEISDEISEGKADLEKILNTEKTRIIAEYKILEDESLQKISSYKNEMMRLQESIANIDETCNSFIGKKLEEIDGQFNIVKFEFDERFKFAVNEVSDKVRILESDFNKKILEIEKMYSDKSEKTYSENLNKIRAFNEQFESVSNDMALLKEKLNVEIELKIDSGKEEIQQLFNAGKDSIENVLVSGKESLDTEYKVLEDQTRAKINQYKQELSGLQHAIELIDQKYNEKFTSKLSEYDKTIFSVSNDAGKLIENLNNVHAEYSQKAAALSSKFSEIQNEFNNRLNLVENNYVEKSEKLLSEKSEKIEDILLNFASLSTQIDNLKNNVDTDISSKIENGKSYIEEMLKNGINNILNQKDKLDEILNAGNRRFENEIEKFDNEMSAKAEKYKTELSTLKTSLEEITERFQHNYDSILIEIDARITDFVSDINQKYDGNLDELYKESKLKLSTFAGEMDNISKDIISVKDRLEGDILLKIEDGKKQIETLFGNSNVKLVEQYRNPEGETVRQINEYRNEVFRIKQNIQQLDDKLLGLFSEKVKDFDGKLNVSFKEVEDKYQKNIVELKDKFNGIEGDLNRRIGGIEATFNEKGDVMLLKNSERLDSFVAKFQELNGQIISLKSTIDDDITKKVEEGREKISEMLNTQIEKTQTEYKKAEIEVEEKLGDFRKEIVKVQQNIKLIDDKFTAKFLDHANVLDKKIAAIEDDLKKIEKAASVFDKASDLKEKLGSDVKMLKEDIARIKTDRDDILVIEKKMMEIKDIFEVSKEKCNAIMSEKKKIDNISVIVNELKLVSENVEEKIESVKTAKVMVTGLEDKIGSVNEKFNLLNDFINEVQKKENDIQGSIEQVGNLKTRTDEINGKLELLHKRFDDLDFKKATFEKSLKNFEKEAGIIGKSEAKVSEVMEKFTQMNMLIEDLEERTGAINKIREWLVRAETQIENLNVDTDKRIKLLESLIAKTGDSPVIKDKMKDDGSKRELVLQLQSQGWTVDDISKTLNLSVGEVEFILDLELTNRKKR